MTYGTLTFNSLFFRFGMLPCQKYPFDPKKTYIEYSKAYTNPSTSFTFESCIKNKRYKITAVMIRNFGMQGSVAFLNLRTYSSSYQIKSYRHYTRCNTPKRVTSWRVLSPRQCARATELLSKKCCSGGEPMATLCPI